MTGFDAGRVVLRLTQAGGKVAAVAAACERPDIAAALRGKPADQAVALVPLIYSLCGKAQGVAARSALAAARGAALAPHVDAECAAEAVREHAWKLLVDWPRQLGLPPDEFLFVRVAKAVPGEAASLATELRAHPALRAMAERLEQSPADIDRALRARLAVRCEELLCFLEGGATPLGTVAALPLGAGRGRATVATARGELSHEIALDGAMIAAYAIEAPTDRLFGDGGPLAGWLVGQPHVGADATAKRAVMLLDPCVPWSLELVEAQA